MEEAIQHYCSAFGIEEVRREQGGVELVGTNFSLWLDVADGRPLVMQEWVTNDGDEARKRIVNAGGTVTSESSSGFYVTDPYGMTYHVFVADEPEG